MRSAECGDSLLEVVVAVAIIAITVGAVGAALIAAEHRFGPDSIESALEASVSREMRVAVDVMKYQGASLPSTSIATTIPLPSGSPLPTHLTLTSTTAAGGAVTIVLRATDDIDTAKSATLSQAIAAPAPPPGTLVPAASNGSAPQ